MVLCLPAQTLKLGIINEQQVKKINECQYADNRNKEEGNDEPKQGNAKEHSGKVYDALIGSSHVELVHSNASKE